MDYNQNNNILYNNYTSKNPSKRSYRTQPYNFFQSPPSQTSNRAPNTTNHYKNINLNYTSNNFSKYNNQIQYQDIYSPHSKNSLKWRNIMKINLPQLKVSGDLNMIESNLDNLIYADISEEDMQSVPESNIVKLIDILQTTSNILMNEREEMEGEINKLENENIQIINEFKMKEKNDIKNKDLLRKLKKEKKRDLGVLNSYQNVINNLKNGNFYNLKQINTNITDINIGNRNAENANLSSKRQGEFKCPHCPDKNFKTEFELHKHLSEVHKIDNGQNQNMQPNQMLQPQINIQLPPNYYDNNNNNEEELLKKMDEMNRQMKETFLKFSEDKKKEEEEAKILNNNENIFYQQGLDRLEKTFNETLNNFKLMMEKNNDNKNENVIIQNAGIDEELYNNRKYEEIRRLKQELENIKNKINEQDYNYENEIKELESNVNTLNIEINEKKKIKEDEMNFSINRSRNPNMNVSINRQFSIETKPAYIRENRQKTNSEENISDNKEKGKKEKYENKKELIEKLIDQKLKEINEIKEKEKEKDKLLQNQINILPKQKEIKPEITKVLEDSNSYFNTIKNKIDLRKEVGQKKNKELENYYKRYIKRDKDYIDFPDFDNYFIHTLPPEYGNNVQINQKCDNIVKDKIRNVGVELFPNNMNIIPKIEEDQLKGENIENLTILINSLMNTMDKKNINKDGKPDDYYLSIKEVLDLDNIKKTTEDISTKFKQKHINDNNKILNKQQNNGEIEENQKKEEELDKKDNKNKVNSIINSHDPNEIKSGIIFNDIQDIDISNENLDNQNTKFRNRNNNKEGNYINNINTNLSDTNNNSNIVLKETVDINQRNNQIINLDSNKDAPYTSTQAQVQTINPNNNDSNKDIPYTSTQAQVQTINPNNNDSNKDIPYTSTQAQVQTTNPNNNDSNKDIPYTSTQAQVQTINPNNNDSNKDAPYTSTQAQVQTTNPNNNNSNKDAPYTSTQSQIHY